MKVRPHLCRKLRYIVDLAVLLIALSPGVSSLAQTPLATALHPMQDQLVLIPALLNRTTQTVDRSSLTLQTSQNHYTAPLLPYSTVPGLKVCQPELPTLYLLVLDDTETLAERSYLAHELTTLFRKHSELQNVAVSIVNQNGQTPYLFPNKQSVFDAIDHRPPARTSPSNADLYLTAIAQMQQLPGPRAVLAGYGSTTHFSPHFFDRQLTTAAARIFAVNVAAPAALSTRFDSMQGIVASSAGKAVQNVKDLATPLIALLSDSRVAALPILQEYDGHSTMLTAPAAAGITIGTPFPAIEVPCSKAATLHRLSTLGFTTAQPASIQTPTVFYFPLRDSSKILVLLVQDASAGHIQPTHALTLVTSAGTDLALADLLILNPAASDIAALYLLAPGSYEGSIDFAVARELHPSTPAHFNVSTTDINTPRHSSLVAGTVLSLPDRPMENLQRRNLPTISVPAPNSPLTFAHLQLLPRLSATFLATERLGLMVRVLSASEQPEQDAAFVVTQDANHHRSSFPVQRYFNPNYGTAYVLDQPIDRLQLPSGTYTIRFHHNGQREALEPAIHITIQ